MNADLTAEVMAYVDGELGADEAAAFEARLSAEPALQRAVQRERALRSALSATYDPVLQEPVPAPLQALLATRSAAVLSLDAARAARAPAAPAGAARRWQWPEWGAMAACLVLGVTLGLTQPWQAGSGGAPLLARAADGTLLAQGPLAHELGSGLASAPAAQVAVGLSFAAHDGRYCRSFALAGAQPTAGLACRGDAGWVVQALAGAPQPPQGGFRMAATALPPSLLKLVDELRSGDVLDAAAERAARDAGWRRP